MSHQNNHDDLKTIKGIGPITEKRLRKAGITTFVEIAKQSPEDLAKLIHHPGAKQIANQKWIQQAQSLTSTHNKNSIEQVALSKSNRQRYATFTLEILVDKSDRVRRMRVVHIQSGEENHWPSWDEARLVGYLIQKAQIKLSSRPKIVAGEGKSKPTPPSRFLNNTQPTKISATAEEDVLSQMVDSLPLSLAVTKILLTPQASRIHTQCSFELTGTGALEIAALHARFVIGIFALNLLTSQVSVMASCEGALEPEQLGYSIFLEFPTPKIGRYQLETTVLLPDEDMVTTYLGPLLTTIP